MRKLWRLIILVFIVLGLVWACNEDENGDPNYPTTISKLSEAELNSRFDLIFDTPLYGCALLNDHGYFVFNLRDRNLCSINDSVAAEYTYEELISLAKQTVFSLPQFFEVNDTSEMRVESVVSYTGKKAYDSYNPARPDSFPPAWQITFHPQQYNGLEVRGTRISLIMDAYNVVAVDGNWFKEIYTPNVEEYTEDAIIELLKGIKIIYKTTSFTPNDETVWRTSKKVLVPVYRSEKIELRVCLAMFTGAWEILVDTQTGERISAINLNLL